MAYATTSSGGGSGVSTIPLTNANAGTAVAGCPVYNSAAGSFDKAQADTLTHARCIGLTQADVATAALGNIQQNGPLTLTTAQWDAVCGTVGGLAFGTPYYVDPTTAGKLTSVSPSTASQFSTLVGTGISPTIMALSIQPPIGL